LHLIHVLEVQQGPDVGCTLLKCCVLWDRIAGSEAGSPSENESTSEEEDNVEEEAMDQEGNANQ